MTDREMVQYLTSKKLRPPPTYESSIQAGKPSRMTSSISSSNLADTRDKQVTQMQPEKTIFMRRWGVTGRRWIVSLLRDTSSRERVSGPSPGPGEL